MARCIDCGKGFCPCSVSYACDCDRIKARDRIAALERELAEERAAAQAGFSSRERAERAEGALSVASRELSDARTRLGVLLKAQPDALEVVCNASELQRGREMHGEQVAMIVDLQTANNVLRTEANEARAALAAVTAERDALATKLAWMAADEHEDTKAVIADAAAARDSALVALTRAEAERDAARAERAEGRVKFVEVHAIRAALSGRGAPSAGAARWTTLAAIGCGAIFETRSGVRAVKSEYRYPYGGIECVLLASGEYAHFDQPGCDAAKHNATEVRGLAIAESAPVPAVPAEAVRALVDALPGCMMTGPDNGPWCGKPATKAWSRGSARYCDEHAPNRCPDYPRAAPLRAVLALLEDK